MAQLKYPQQVVEVRNKHIQSYKERFCCLQMQNYKIELFGFPSSGKCIKLVLTIYIFDMARSRAPDLFTYEIQRKVNEDFFQKAL